MSGPVILVEDNDELARFYSLNLHVWVGATVLHAKDLRTVESLIKEHQSAKLVISKSSYTPIVKKFLEGESLRNISQINLGPGEFDGVSIENGLNIKPLMQAAAKALGVTAQDMAKLEVPEYFPIPISHFGAINSSSADIYLEQDGNHELIFQANAQIDSTRIVELAKSGIKELHVNRSQRLKIVTHISQEIVSNINPKDLDEAQALSANEMSQKLVQYKLQKIGITAQTTEMAKRNIKNMVQASRKYPKLSQLVKRLTKNKAGYLYKHSQVLMFVCSHLMDNIDWGNDEQKKTINFVAFFHDIALTSDEQAKIHSEAELKTSNLNDQAKKLVNMHAQIAAELVQKFPQAPMGADSIVRQHHGIAHGVGFSQHYSANLSPMTIVFVLAEDFVDYILESGDDIDIHAKIKQMRERYPTQRFQKILDILEDVTL